jgi:hypothetical protein
MTKSWKTTSAGILAIVGGVLRIVFALKSGQVTEEAVLSSTSAILVGIGLIFAKDSDVTGGTVQQ